MSREEKVAAAHIKLKKFQQARLKKITPESTGSQSISLSGTAENYFQDGSNLSSKFESGINEFSCTNVTVPLFDASVPEPVSSVPPVSTEADNKSRSLADYFSSHSNDSCDMVVPTESVNNAPEWPFFTPSSVDRIPAPISVATISNTESLPMKQDCQTNSVPVYSVSDISNDKLDMVQPAEQHSVHDPSTAMEFGAINSGSVDEEKFDNVPTATTERIMQISRQLNGLLQSSEQLVTTFGTCSLVSPSATAAASFPAVSSSMYSSIGSDTTSVDVSSYTNTVNVVTSFNGYNRTGPSSPLTGQNSPISVTQQQQHPNESFMNHTTQIKRSDTPNSTHSANHVSSYVRELEERNVELAALLDKRSRAHERALAKLSVIQEQSTRAANQAASDKAHMEAAAQRDLSKARDQIRAHAQTIGALVAEKTELQTKVQHLERLSQQRAQEIEDLSNRMETFRKHSTTMEETVASSKVELEKAASQNAELYRQLERAYADAKRQKSLCENFQAELEEASSRLNSRTYEITQLEVSINDLRRQLELAQVCSTQFNGLNDETDLAPQVGTVIRSDEVHSGIRSSNDWLKEREELIKKLQEHEQSLSQISRDREHLESQYQSYVAQVEQQAAELRTQLSEATRSNRELELMIDNARRQLRERDDELITCRGELEVTRTQLTAATAAAAAATTATSRLSSVETVQLQSVAEPKPDDRVVELQRLLDEQKVEVDKLSNQVSELSSQLDTAREALVEKETLLADRDMVLATATSERVTLSRAMEQNRNLKEQLTELQDAFVQMSNKNMELTTALRAEQQLQKERYQAEVGYRAELEQLRAKCAQMEKDCGALMVTCDSHAHVHTAVPNETDSAHAHDTVHSTHQTAYGNHNQQIEQLVQELQASHCTIDGLSGRAEELDAIVHRLGLLMDWLQTQQLSAQSAAHLSNTLSGHHLADPVELFAKMERLVRAIIAQRDEEVATQARQNMEHMSTIKLLPSVEDWKSHQTAYEQLQAKFVACMDKMSRVDEERTRLESLNTQLEMEASTVGEYVTLFTHRRAAAARRARAREQLLRRLVQDRRRLRARLHDLLGLYDETHANQLGDSEEPTTKECGSTSDLIAKVMNNEESQAKFLTDFKRLLQEIGPTIDETESDSGFSLHNDELVAEQETKQHNSNYVSDEDKPREAHADFAVGPQMSISPLEQLRKQALQHDCPHCQCCVGNLIEV